jgi:hypothetical protein
VSVDMVLIDMESIMGCVKLQDVLVMNIEWIWG